MKELKINTFLFNKIYHYNSIKHSAKQIEMDQEIMMKLKINF